MGQQVCFFITPNDLRCFLDAVLPNEIILLDKYGKTVTSDDLYEKAEDVFNKKQCYLGDYYFTKDGFNLSYSQKSNTIDCYRSEVIQFGFVRHSQKTTLDMSSIDKRFSKNGFTVIDDDEVFQKMLEELYANPVYIDNPAYVENGYEHGRLWFSNTYYDDNGIIINKRDELKKTYNSLKRFITKNWKIANNKFGYIGTDAYKLYLENKFRPCSGKSLIKFD